MTSLKSSCPFVDDQIGTIIKFENLEFCVCKKLGSLPVVLLDKKNVCRYVTDGLKQMAKVCHSLVGNDEGIAHISCTEERLQLAVKNGHYEYARFLLQNDADPISGRFSDPEMSLIYQEDANLTAFLLSFGGNPNVYDHEGLTPLMRACRKGDAGTTTAIVLLTYGADVNAFAMPEQDLRTPLHYAVLYGSIKLVSLLIEHGAHVNQPCGYDRPSVLNLAVLKDDPELLRLLLDAGAKPNAVHTSIGSSLHIAACSPLKNQFEIMRLLLEFGADVNLRHTFPEGDVLPTPFVEYFKSQEKVDKKVVHLLLAYGAEVIVRSPLTDARGQLFNLREIYILQPDVFNVMLDVGEEYECTAIDRLSTVDSLKKLLISKASCPASLQQQCRLRIRRLLIPMCPAKVATLSIPEHLRPYLLGYAL